MDQEVYSLTFLKHEDQIVADNHVRGGKFLSLRVHYESYASSSMSKITQHKLDTYVQVDRSHNSLLQGLARIATGSDVSVKI